MAPVAPGEQAPGDQNPDEIFERAERLEDQSHEYLTLSELPKAIATLKAANACRTPLLGPDHWGVADGRTPVEGAGGAPGPPGCSARGAVSALARWESAAREFDPSQGMARTDRSGQVLRHPLPDAGGRLDPDRPGAGSTWRNSRREPAARPKPA